MSSKQVCTHCGKKKPLKEFISVGKKRLTKQCKKCRTSRGARAKAVRHEKQMGEKVEQPRAAICPFESGDIKQKPFGCMM